MNPWSNIKNIWRRAENQEEKMLREEKREERTQYNKKDTYTYEEVRSRIEAAMEDRARYLGFFYKVMPRDMFDKYAKKALYAYGV